MFYALKSDHPVDDNNGYYDINDGLEFDGVGNWGAGEPFERAPPNPIIVEISPINGFKGEPPEMADGSMCLMSDRMVAVLKKSGVNNLDAYPTILRDSETPRDFPYQSVNVIGLLAAADLDASTWEAPDGRPFMTTLFDKLVIDEKVAKDQLLFRLAENGAIVVHQRIKDALEAAGLSMLKFLPLGK